MAMMASVLSIANICGVEGRCAEYCFHQWLLMLIASSLDLDNIMPPASEQGSTIVFYCGIS